MSRAKRRIRLRRRPRRRPVDGRPVERLGPAPVARRAGEASGHRLQPQPESRGYGRGPGVPAGAGDQNPGPAKRLSEIVGVEADPALEPRKVELAAKPGGEPGIGRRKLRPDALVEPGDDGEIRLLKPGLD